jgi:hypothetical protein
MRSPAQYTEQHDGTLTQLRLRTENRLFRGSGGVSENNRTLGFRPAFLDSATGHVYLSRFANGVPAPVHMLDGLPDDLVVQRSAEGRIAAVKHTVIAGFLYADNFYTRDQAALICESC